MLCSPRNLARVFDEEVELACTFTGRTERRPARLVVMVTSRQCEATVFDSLNSDPVVLEDSGILSLSIICDACVPGTIANSAWSGCCDALVSVM
jgi:dimethylamine/trimethylamine dehydrogenase